MTSGEWWSQPFPPEGAITSEGIRNQLGRPAVDPLTIFVRESAQNSWDARTRSQPVQYMLDVEAVPQSHMEAWRDALSRGAPAEANLPLTTALAAESMRILAVSDRGTKGLGGPTRADVTSDGPRDWISFVLNVGEARDTAGGGGTYGYGKAVFYRLSRVGTVLIHTRTRYEGRVTTRLIGVALGESFVSNGVPHTGRHWWGDRRSDHVEPLVDAAADDAAEALGIPPFVGDETGTTIIVVDPDFGDDLPDAVVAGRLADTIAWQLWPMMLPERGDDRLDPSVTCRGEDFLVPDPARTYPLDMFVRAYRELRTGRSRVIECLRPRQHLGALSLQRRAVSPGREGSEAARNAGVPADPHHVCLLRSPELVVRYLEGPVPFSTGSAYAGVFRADDELDDVFAAAEPPTHDDWVAEQMTGHGKTFVRQTKLRILAELKEYARPASLGAGSAAVPLGAASNFLGSLVAASGGSGARFDLADAGVTSARGRTAGGGGGGGGGDGGGGGGGTSRSRRVRALLVGDPVWERRAGEMVLVQRVALPRGTETTTVRGAVAVTTADGSREAEPPVGAEVPEVIGWDCGGEFVTGDVATVEAGVEVALVVRPATDAVVEIEVTATVPTSGAS